MGHERRKDLHEPGGNGLVLVGVVLPRRNLRRPRRECRVGRNHTERDLPLVDLRPQPIPALVERALESLNPFRGDMVRRMHRSRSEVAEERAMRSRRLLTLDPGDRLVGEILGQVVVVTTEVGFDRRGLVIDRRLPVRRLGTDDAVKAIEAHPGGPSVKGPRRALLPRRREMPFAEGARAVAVPPQDLGDGGRLLRDCAVVPGKAVRDLGDAAHVHRMMISASEKSCPSGGTQRRRVELVVAKPGTRHPVDCRGGHRAAECAAGAEADVVEQDQDDVGGIGWRPQSLKGNGLGLVEESANGAGERRRRVR